MRWLGTRNGLFLVSSYYRILRGERETSLLWRTIWFTGIPPKVSFFVWAAALNRILTIDNLVKRQWILVNRCCLCCLDAESVDHPLLHCPVASQLWFLVFSIFGVTWVQPGTMSLALWSWQGGEDG